jgi:hypothetical protein
LVEVKEKETKRGWGLNMDGHCGFVDYGRKSRRPPYARTDTVNSELSEVQNLIRHVLT